MKVELFDPPEMLMTAPMRRTTHGMTIDETHDDRPDCYRYVIELSREIEPLPEAEARHPRAPGRRRRAGAELRRRQ